MLCLRLFIISMVHNKEEELTYPTNRVDERYLINADDLGISSATMEMKSITDDYLKRKMEYDILNAPHFRGILAKENIGFNMY